MLLISNYLEYNYPEKISKMRECINQWNKRFLTPLGKVTVIKTFLMSQINHLLIALPNPSETYIKEINSLFYKFLWSGKPDKINRNIVKLDNAKVGIKMLNLYHSITALKGTWIRRLLVSQTIEKPQWIHLFEKIYNTSINKLSIFGTYFLVVLKKRSQNIFWRNVFDAWIEICSKKK